MHLSINELQILNPTTESLLCGCGQRGCVEVYASAKNTGHILTKRLKASINNNDAEVSLTAKDAFEMAQKGDPIAIEVLNEVNYI
jgi:predicted NBD/HSP70 family sugar kinase